MITGFNTMELRRSPDFRLLDYFFRDVLESKAYVDDPTSVAYL